MEIEDEVRRYSPEPMANVTKRIIYGQPRKNDISTSLIERGNLTLRHQCKRMARLTLAFSKKMENFKAAIALNIAHYNLVKFHKTIRMTPAMAAGVESSPWTIEDLLRL